MLDMFKRPGDPIEHNYLYAYPGAAIVAGGWRGKERLRSFSSECSGFLSLNRETLSCRNGIAASLNCGIACWQIIGISKFPFCGSVLWYEVVLHLGTFSFALLTS